MERRLWARLIGKMTVMRVSMGMTDLILPKLLEIPK
jgi:hypothetical protein